MVYIKKLIVCVVLFAFCGNSLVFASTQLKENTKKQQNLIDDLGKNIEKFQTDHAETLSSSIKKLHTGDTGDEVETVQTLLSLDSSIYPEGLITGYFGQKTRDAIKNFQKENNLEQVGNVGPKTLEKLKEFAHDNDLTAEDNERDWKHNGKHEKRKVKTLCTVVPPEHFILSKFGKVWEKREKERIQEIHDQHNTQHNKKHRKVTAVPQCKNIPKNIENDLHNIQPPYDSTDHTAPIVTAPISASAPTGTSMTITWETDENSKSEVLYTETTPVIKENATVVDNDYFGTSHSVTLDSLSPQTTYYFITVSIDASDNSTPGQQEAFTTSTDTIAPVISDLQATNITGNETNIVWKTDTDTTDKIWYGTTSPVITTNTPLKKDDTLYDSHEFELTKLISHTTYYFVISSTDDSGNTTTLEGSFTTL